MTGRWPGVILLALVLGLAPGTIAVAAGDATCNQWGACEASDTDPGSSGAPSSGGSKSSEPDKLPELPQCTSWDVSYTDLPDDIPNPEDWVQVVCLEGELRMTLWIEGGARPEQVARTLLARIQLQPIDIGLVPRGADAMTIVGMPVWLWVDEPSRTTWGPATISAGGVTLTAKVQSVTWDMGDGTTLTCGKGTEWKRGMGGDPSPTCGHTYEEQGSYTIRARSHWVATWSGYGQSGTIPVTLSSTRQLDVGEVQVIVTGG